VGKVVVLPAGEADETGKGRCTNSGCTANGAPIALHETGLCCVCCPLRGSLGCEDCRWGGEEDDE
jgi:hypothetical protein